MEHVGSYREPRHVCEPSPPIRTHPRLTLNPRFFGATAWLAAWTRTYEYKEGVKGRVFCTTYGSSNCIENDGYRRMLLNACFWTMGIEDAIKADSNVDFIGPFNPTYGRERGRRAPGVKPLDMAGWDTPIVPLQE